MQSDGLEAGYGIQKDCVEDEERRCGADRVQDGGGCRTENAVPNLDRQGHGMHSLSHTPANFASHWVLPITSPTRPRTAYSRRVIVVYASYSALL